MKRATYLFVGLAALAVCVLPHSADADELVATSLGDVVTFEGTEEAYYDLQVTVEVGKEFIVLDATSGPDDAQVVPLLGKKVGQGSTPVDIASVTHEPGEAVYIVWGTFPGGRGGGKSSYWTNEYLTDDLSGPSILIEVNDPGDDDDYVGYGYEGGTVTVILVNGTSGATYTVTLENASGPGSITLPSIPPLTADKPICIVPLGGAIIGYDEIGVIVATVGPGLPATAPASKPAPVVAREWSADTVIQHQDRPIRDNPIQVSPGEQIIISMQGVDNDKWRVAGGEWKSVPGTGPYEITFTCGADADFDSVGSGTRSKTIAGLLAKNVLCFTNANWSGVNPITVTAVITDKASETAPTPDSGTTRDTAVGMTWMLTKRGTAPTTIETIALTGCPLINGTWVQHMVANYAYQAGPDIGNDGKADYVNQAVAEVFGANTAGGLFVLNDLTEKWRKDNPTITEEDPAAVLLFPKSFNASFVLNGNDRMADSHRGFAGQNLNAFTEQAKANGIGYRENQDYKAAGNVLGSYTIDRKYTAGQITIKKNGP